MMDAQDPDLELTSNSLSSTPTTGPTDVATFNFYQDTNNPGIPIYSPYTTNPLSVTFSLTNNQYTHNVVSGANGRAINLGLSYLTNDGVSKRMSTGVLGTGINPLYYTYRGGLPSVTGTGITVSGTPTTNQNNGASFFFTSNAFAAYNLATNGTHYVTDLTVSFNRPVDNPVLHFTGMGGNSGAIDSFFFSPSFEYKSSVQSSPSISFSRLSGSSGFQATSTLISDSEIDNTQEAGSVLVTGKGITQIVFKVYYTGTGTNPDPVVFWGNPAAADKGEQFNISVSLGESDLKVTKSVSNTTPAIGSNVTFTIGAENLGISNSPETKVTDLLPSGYTFVSATPSVGTYNNTTGVWDIGTLNSGATASLNIVATVKSTGTYTNTATIEGFNTDPNLSNNTSTYTHIKKLCYENPGGTASDIVPVKHGITLLGRAGKVSTNANPTTSDWPMFRNSAYTALESKTKGFVITRNANPETTITNPVIGMMVFDTDADSGKGCLKINTDGTTTGWKCFNKQSCP